jgi:hypothetical protein
MARRGALVAALLFCMALGAFAGSSYNAYYGKYPSSDYKTTYDAGKLPKGVSYTTSESPAHIHPLASVRARGFSPRRLAQSLHAILHAHACEVVRSPCAIVHLFTPDGWSR